MSGFIPNHVDNVTPRFVLAAAHMRIPVDMAIKAPRDRLTTSVRIRRTRVTTVVDDFEGVKKPNLPVGDETAHAYPIVQTSNMALARATIQVILFCNRGVCKSLPFEAGGIWSVDLVTVLTGTLENAIRDLGEGAAGIKDGTVGLGMERGDGDPMKG